MIYQPAVRSFSGLAYSKFAAIEGASPRGGDQGSGGDLSLLAVFPGRERPHDVAPGRIEGPNSVVSLVLDLPNAIRIASKISRPINESFDVFAECRRAY